MSERETPMTRWYWEQVGGTLIEEFPAVLPKGNPMLGRRVLAGVQVPPVDADEFARHLRELGYPYTEETDNPAYRMFLGHG